MSFLISVDSFYRKNKIHSLDFDCAHKQECEAEATYWGRERQGPKSSFIGSRYGEGGLPRVVFLSLDPGNLHYVREEENRTPEAVQRIHEDDKSGPRNVHWAGTHLLALRFFNSVDNRFHSIAESILEVTQGKWRAIGDVAPHLVPVLPHFAHVNTAKCCGNRYDDKSGNNRMTKAPGGFFVKCRSFAQQELEKLEPDVIVTQGKEAADVLLERRWERPLEFAVRYPNERIRIAEIGGRKVLWLATTHPAIRNQTFWEEACTCGSNDWCEYVCAFADFTANLRRSNSR